MEMNKFYEFGDGFSRGTFQSSLVKQIGPQPEGYVSEHERLQWGNYEGIDFPVVFEHDLGHLLKDILGTGWTSFYLISDRMKTVLEQNNLTGWKTFPIKLLGKKGDEIHGYHGFSITGRSGPSDHTNAIMFEKEHYPGSSKFGKYYRGMSVDISKWDCTDFFKPSNTCEVIVTEKAAKAMKEAHLTNVKLTNLMDVEISESTYKFCMSKSKPQQNSTNSTE